MEKKTKKSLKITVGIFLILVGFYLVYLNLSWQIIVSGLLLAAIGIGVIASISD